MHPAERLWQRHHPAGGYPTGVVAVPEPIPGVAFFPGGFGLYRQDIAQPLPPMPTGKVMVLGHDFHSEAGYRKSVARTREAQSQPTWRNLLRVLDEVGIAPTDCFFTNVFMGLRQGDATTGRFPGANDEVFVAFCERFLIEQLRALRPSLIITLGINVPPLLGRVVPELADWAGGRGLRFLDSVGPVRRAVALSVDPLATANVVALTHPSLRHASIRHRHYADRRGHEAEILMLRDALAAGTHAARGERGAG
jgi:hypothetical protein